MKPDLQDKEEPRARRGRSADTRLRILQHAGELIGERGEANVAIREVAEAAGVSTALVHTLIGRGREIIKAIINSFLGIVDKQIETALRYQPSSSTPALRLIKLLDATLDVFDDHTSLGKAVLRELTIPPGNTESPIMTIFGRVDRIIGEAREAGELNDWAKQFADWEIRQALFALTYGLLRACYLNEGRAPEADGFDRQKVRTLVLRFLQTFCAKEAQEKIGQEIHHSSGHGNH